TREVADRGSSRERRGRTQRRVLCVGQMASKALALLHSGGWLVSRLIMPLSGRFIIARLLHSLVIITMGFTLAGQSSVSTPDQSYSIEIDVAKAREYWLAAGTTGLLAPETVNGVVQSPLGNIGWFDYDFRVDRQGWYRLLVDASPHISRTEFLFDPTSPESKTRLRGET